MSKPLALLCCSNSLLGNQLAGRLQELGYRVQTVSSPGLLQETCETEKPLIVLAEISGLAHALPALARVKDTTATSHIPVLAFSASPDKALQTAAEDARVSLLSGTTAILDHLPQLLEQALQI